MTVGYFAPEPYQQTGVADYAAALLPALTQRLPVRVGDESAAVPLYHLGNNKLHEAIYNRALTKPGVIVLHDAVLHHFLLGHLNRSEYMDEFVYNYGAWTAQQAEDLWTRRGRSGADPEYFNRPMLRRIVERSLAVIVHSEAARVTVLRHVPAARVTVIPHFFVHPGNMQPERLPVPDGAVVLAVLGHLRETKRVLPILRVFNRLKRERIAGELLLAGECTSPDLRRAIDYAARGTPLIRLGHLETARWWRIAQRADICINLRYPQAGETSGIGIRLMGLGKAVICTEGSDDAPEGTCLPIRAGIAEEDELAATLTWLIQYGQDRREIGRRAAEHIAQHHDLATIADRYIAVLREAGS